MLNLKKLWWHYGRIIVWVIMIVSSVIITWALIHQFDTSTKKVDVLDVAVAIIAWLAFMFSTDQTVCKPILESPHLVFKVEPQKSDEQGSGTESSNFLRLKITNWGPRAAKNCVGRLLEVRDQEEKKITIFDPLSLYWARQNAPTSFEVDIQGYGDTEYLDVVQAHMDQLRLRVVIPSGMKLTFDPRYPEAPALPKGTYSLRIGIFAEGAHIKPEWFTLEWKDGEPIFECRKRKI
jgi:hypothetical protein